MHWLKQHDWASGIAIVVSVAGFLLLPGLASAADTVIKTSGLIYARGVTERGSTNLKLDLYKPTRGCERSCPVVIALHGGGFEKGSRTDKSFVQLARNVAEAGYAVAMIDYRLAGDRPRLSTQTQAFLVRELGTETASTIFGATGPARVLNASFAAIEDTLAATVWISRNAETYGLDGRRVVLWGSSSGAITALNTAYGFETMRVSSAAQIAGVVNYQGQLFSTFPMTKNGPPMMIVHGETDATVSFEHSKTLYEDARRTGVTVWYFPLADGEHGLSRLNPLSTSVRGLSLMDYTLDFLGATLKRDRPLRSGCMSDTPRLCP